MLLSFAFNFDLRRYTKGSISAHTVINPALRYEPYNITIAGLHPKSTYDLYVVAIDDDVAPYGGNLQALATQLTFKAGLGERTKPLASATSSAALTFADPRFSR